MGKKRVGGQGQQVNVTAAAAPVDTRRYWCYYCGNEARDEATLIQHQAAKHFQCPYCDPKAYGRLCQSLAGLISHVRRSHRKELTKVPGAIEGRDSPEVDVYGMTGIPSECLPPESEAPDVESALQAAAQAARLQEAATYQQPKPQFDLPPMPMPKFDLPPLPQQAPQPQPSNKQVPRISAPSMQSSHKSEKMEGLTKALLAAASAPNSSTPESGQSADPEGKTKALLAALATNTPEGIKAALRETTQPKHAPAPVQQAQPEPNVTFTPEPWFPQENVEPSGGVSVKTLVRLEKRLVENAMASARTLAAPKKDKFAIDPKLKSIFGMDDGAQDSKQAEAPDEEFPDPSRRLYMGKIPRGTGEGLIRAECVKYGAVASILYNTTPEDPFEEPWALVAFTSADSVHTAVNRLKRRMGLFGAAQPVEVRQGTEYDINRMEELLKAAEAMRPHENEKPATLPKSSDTLPAFLEQAQQMAAAGGAPMSLGSMPGAKGNQYAEAPGGQERQRSRSYGRHDRHRNEGYEENSGRGGYDWGDNKGRDHRGGYKNDDRRGRSRSYEDRGRTRAREQRDDRGQKRGAKGEDGEDDVQVDPYLLAEQGIEAGDAALALKDEAEVQGGQLAVRASRARGGQQLAVQQRERSVSSSYSPEPVRAPKPRKVYGLGGFDNIAAEGQPAKAPNAPTAMMICDGGGQGDPSLQLAVIQDSKKIYDPFRVENTSDLVKPGSVSALSLIGTGEDFGAFSGGRHIGTRSGWAEFVTMDRRSYYVNVLTGAKTRHLPKEARRTR